jgi:hypothetical protein
MAFKWTKASRAKLSRSQKARWKERNSSVGSVLNVPDSVIGVVKIGHSGAGRAGSGRLNDPLLGWLPLQLIEDQAAMLLEYAQRPFERMEHRLSNRRGVASI